MEIDAECINFDTIDDNKNVKRTKRSFKDYTQVHERFSREKRGWAKALGLCVLVSTADQVLKGFLPGREFDWTDFPFDATGYLVGILIVWVLAQCRRKVRYQSGHGCPQK